MNKNVTAIVIIATLAFAKSGGAAEPPASGEQLSSLAECEQTLQKAGASRAELAIFEGWVRGMSAADLTEYGHYIEKNPSYYVRRLRREAKDEQEPAPPAIFPGVMPVMSCEALRGVSIPDTRIDSIAIAASDGSCRITATATHPPADNPIKVFIALPSKAWNGRFMGTGGGGYAGGSAKNLDAPARKGYAVGATDTGNPQGTAQFAVDSHGKPAWQRMRDNAYIGIHDMTVVGKALTAAFYGKTPRYAYFVGGSTGGRQALTEAQRYPQDYDGILALYPAMARDRYVPAQLWPQILMNEVHDFLPRVKLEAATAAAVKACDAADGVLDGVIDDPTQCRYNPDALVGSKVGDSTFTATDAQIIRGIWKGPQAHDRRFLWWGPTPGTDLSILADTGGTPLTGKPCEEGLDWFRYFLVLDPKWDWKTLTREEFERSFGQSIQTHAGAYGGDDPNLTGFHDRGGKLLIVHGWADQLVPAQESVAYYQALEQRMGGAEPTAQFVRLFLVPGGDHGFSAPVPSPRSAEMLDNLIQWVEHGHAPEKLVAELYGDDGKPVRTRPLFPYPQVDPGSRPQAWLGRLTNQVTSSELTLLKRSQATLLGNVTMAEPWKPYRGIMPSLDTYKGIWNWDAAFHAVAVSHWDPVLAREQIQILFDNQQPNGSLPDVIWQKGGMVTSVTKPPVMAWAVAVMDRRSPDTAFLKTMYPKLVRLGDFWLKERGGEADGLFYYAGSNAALDAGQDNSIRWDNGYASATSNSHRLWAIDLNCYMVMHYRAMAYLADRLRLSDDKAKWLEKARALAHRIDETLWDDSLGFYVDRDRVTHQNGPALSPAGFMPLFVHIAGADKAARVARLATDPHKFFPGMPTASYDTPGYEERNMWRGPTWLNTSYFALKGLKDYGYAQGAETMRTTLLGWVSKDESTIWEYYDSKTGEGVGGKGFGWSAAFAIAFVLDWNNDHLTEFFREPPDLKAVIR